MYPAYLPYKPFYPKTNSPDSFCHSPWAPAFTYLSIYVQFANSWQCHRNDALRGTNITAGLQQSFPPLRDRPSHWGHFPFSLRTVCGCLMSHRIYMLKGCETKPTVYCPYKRRLESWMVCTCLYEGSTFSSVILRPWVLVWLGPPI